MHLRTWLTIAALTTALGCGDDAGGESVASKEETRTAALALTEAVDFENGISRTGGIPAATADSITLIPDTESLVLVPGDSAEMTMGFENPDEDKDPVDAVLLQFSDSDDHIEVARVAGDAGAGDAGAGDSEMKMPFSIDDKVCDKLCDKVFKLSLNQAVKLKGSGVSKHKSRSFDLDCSTRGDHSVCAAVKADKPSSTPMSEPSGTGGKSGSTGASATLGTVFGSALAGFNASLCTCQAVPADMTTPCVDAVNKTDRDCLKNFAVANASEVQMTIGCINQQLMSCSSACGAMCDPKILLTLPTTCEPPLTGALLAEYLACLPKSFDKPSTAADAGVTPAP